MSRSWPYLGHHSHIYTGLRSRSLIQSDFWGEQPRVYNEVPFQGDMNSDLLYVPTHKCPEASKPEEHQKRFEDCIATALVPVHAPVIPGQGRLVH